MEVLNPGGGMDDDIVEVRSSRLVVGAQNDVHQCLESCWSPVEAKCEDPVLPVP